jgi:hypothetical protein
MGWLQLRNNDLTNTVGDFCIHISVIVVLFLCDFYFCDFSAFAISVSSRFIDVRVCLWLQSSYWLKKRRFTWMEDYANRDKAMFCKFTYWKRERNSDGTNFNYAFRWR